MNFVARANPGGRPKKPTKTTNQKLDAEIVRKGRVVASIRGIDASAYFTDLLRPLVEPDYRKALETELKNNPE